ncbi:MAG: hypothetical protein EAX96_01960 [Candidatus Lokiarchaeota archaeon]|nr:hypothetical protein [Candidatus Lokiarchaeota archaeon]
MVNFITIDDLKNKKRALIFFAFIGALNFIIMTIIAMFFYPRPYNFFFDHFSSLGFLDANWSSQFFGGISRPYLPNPVSPILFVIALIIAGVAMIPLWIFLPSQFKECKLARILSWLGSGAGLISSPFLMLVGVPADYNIMLHGIGAMYFFLFFAIAIIIYVGAILLNKEYPNGYAIFGIIVGVVAIAYVFIPFSILNAFHQKVTVYLFIAWAMVQVFQVWPNLEK